MAIITTIVYINVSFAPVNVVIETVITKPLVVPILGEKRFLSGEKWCMDHLLKSLGPKYKSQWKTKFWGFLIYSSKLLFPTHLGLAESVENDCVIF